MAGHADLATTMKYYAKVDKSTMIRMRDASERYTQGVVA